MKEFPDIFGNDQAMEIFYVISIAFVLLYAAGIVFLQRWSPTSGRIPAIRRHVISGVGAALGAMGVAFGLHAANITMASATGQSAAATSISPHELHRSVDMKLLPVSEFEDHTFIFPKRD